MHKKYRYLEPFQAAGIHFVRQFFELMVEKRFIFMLDQNCVPSQAQTM